MIAVNGKLTTAQSTLLKTAITNLRPRIVSTLAVYVQATPDRREELLAHSPVLSAFIDMLQDAGIQV